MKKYKKAKSAIVTAFSLKPENMAQLAFLAQANEGNMSYTVRKLIEDAWKAQSAKETK